MFKASLNPWVLASSAGSTYATPVHRNFAIDPFVGRFFLDIGISQSIRGRPTSCQVIVEKRVYDKSVVARSPQG